MAEQRFTIIIVPHDRPGVRKLQISAKVLLYGLIALAMLSLTALGTTIHYVKLFRVAQDLASVQQENIELKTSLEQSQYLTQKLNRKLSFLTDLSNKLKTMAGLPNSPPGKEKIASQLRKPGIGGITMDSTRIGAPDPQRLLALESRTQYLEQSFTLLNEYFQQKNLQLASTPSILPTQGFLSSYFGARPNPFTNAPDFHEGIDITNEVGTPVIAPAAGTVIFTGLKGNYGNVVEIQHDGAVTTLYGHLAKIQVKVGQRVNRWDVIGQVGNTGRSTGPHLHYEVHIGDQPVNPLPYILDLNSLG